MSLLPDYDPLTFYDRQLQRLTGGFGAARPPARFPALSPAEEERELGSLGHRVLGGVGYAGASLDKALGARAIRGLLGGKPEELLSLIPFSDALGWTDPANAVYGRDLLEKAGVLGPNREGLDAGDVAGFAADVLLDPLTYLTFGTGAALTGPGRLAKAAGVLPKGARARLGTTLGALAPAGSQAADDVLRASAAAGRAVTPELLNAPLTGLLRVRIPFTQGETLLAGQSGIDALDAFGRAAAKIPGLSRAGNALAPIGRSLGALFQKSKGGAITPEGQPAAELYHAAVPGKEAAAKLAYVEEVLHPLGDASLLRPERLGATQDELNNILEGIASPVRRPIPYAPDPLIDAALAMRRQLDETAQRSEVLGVGGGRRTFYTPHQMSAAMKEAKGVGSAGGRPVGTLDPFDANVLHREEELLGNLPRDWVNAIALRRGELQPLSQLDRAKLLREEHLFPWEEAQRVMGRPEARVTVPAAQMEARWLHLTQNHQPLNAVERAELVRLDSLAAQGQPLSAAEQAQRAALATRFNEGLELDRLLELNKRSELLADYIPSLPGGLPAAERAELAGLQGFTGPLSRGQLARQADLLKRDVSLPLFGGDLLSDVLTRLLRGGRREAKAESLYGMLVGAVRQPGTGPTAPLTDVLDNLRTHANYTVDAQLAMKRALGMPPGASLQGLAVPQSLADDVVRTVQQGRAGEAAGPLLGAFDSWTNFTKAMQIGFWPAKFARDALQQAVAAPMYGLVSPQRLPGALDDARRLFRRGATLADANTVPGLTHLTPEQASRKLQDLAYAHDVTGRAAHLTREGDVIGAAGDVAQDVRLPGDPRPGPGTILADMFFPWRWQDKWPHHVAGVGGRERTTFGPVRAGQELSGAIDDVTRGGAWLELMRQGYTPGAAAEAVRDAFYDMSNLSGFERSVMRRVFPFYSWSRQNVPSTVRELATNPGGPMATAVKATARGHQEGGFQPPYIAETLGIPLGASETPGRTRYLTTLGLPFEDLRNITAGRGLSRNVGETAERYLGEMNPVLKVLPELATGKQFYTGRNLDDLHGPTGDPGLDQLLMNSPLSRFYTTARTLADPAKGVGAKALNVLGPTKVTDVAWERSKDRAAQEVIAELLRGAEGVRVMQRPYVPMGAEALLSPEEVALMRLQATLEKRAQERAKAQSK